MNGTVNGLTEKKDLDLSQEKTEMMYSHTSHRFRRMDTRL